MTHTRTLTPQLFEWPQITWQHVAASCAVPLFLRNYRIAGEWYCDGGIVDPLPLAAAVAMGARRIVTVNLLKHRPWLVRAAVRGLRRLSRYAPIVPHDVAVIDVSPDSPLGPVRESMYWSRETAVSRIERGRRDARARKAAIVQWSEREFQELGNVPYPSPA
jgi:predicted acylesterase/phospholipase RssA